MPMNFNNNYQWTGNSNTNQWDMTTINPDIYPQERQAVYYIADRSWYFDPSTYSYTSVEDPKVILTQEMVSAIQQGAAVLDWNSRRLNYVQKGGHVMVGEPYMQYADNKDRENRDWLDREIAAVCQLVSV